MPAKTADKWITLEFSILENGVERHAVVQINAHRIGDSLEDLTQPVATILANAISAQTGYTLISAIAVTETLTQIFPPA